MNPIHSTDDREREAPVRDGGEAIEGDAPQPGSLREVLGRLVGKKVVLADPQSLEEVPVGHALMTKIVPAKVQRCTEDSLCILRHFTRRSARRRGEELMQQWIPFSRVKGVSFRKDEIVLHL